MNEELTNDEVEIDLVDLGYVLLVLLQALYFWVRIPFSLSHLPMNPQPSFT